MLSHKSVLRRRVREKLEAAGLWTVNEISEMSS